MNVLVVEDNREVAELLKDILEEQGYTAILQSSPDSKRSLLNIQAILLDENLNGQSGLDYLKFLKTENQKWNGPVIMVTGNNQDGNIKRVFEVGVDDYITKPFKPLVLAGKLKALSTRLGLKENVVISVGPIEIEPREHKVRISGEEANLTLTEYKILKELVDGAGHLVTRDTLKTKVYGDMFVTNRRIDGHICSLRKKLKEFGDALKTIRGVRLS